MFALQVKMTGRKLTWMMRMKGPERVVIVPAVLSLDGAAPTLHIDILTGTTNHATGQME